MRRKKLRWQKAKRNMRVVAKRKQYWRENDAWYEEATKRNEIIKNLEDSEIDTFLIKEWFERWQTAVETEKANGRKLYGKEKLEAVAFLGFRPNHPKTAKFRRWFKRRAAKPSELSQDFWWLTTDHFGREDDPFTMAGYHAMIRGIKRFLKANNLYKIEAIAKNFKCMSKSMHFCWIPKRDIEKYKKCICIWRSIADAKEVK